MNKNDGGISPSADRTATPRRSTVPDLPLILEQLQDQLDQIRSVTETQQTVIEAYETRLAAVEHQLATLARP